MPHIEIRRTDPSDCSDWVVLVIWKSGRVSTTDAQCYTEDEACAAARSVDPRPSGTTDVVVSVHVVRSIWRWSAVD